MSDLITKLIQEIYEELYRIHYHHSDEVEPVINLNEAIRIIKEILNKKIPNIDRGEMKIRFKNIIVKELTRNN